jgi:hypothetical protein
MMSMLPQKIEAHGTVSASPTSVLGGGSSTITITPSSGYLYGLYHREWGCHSNSMGQHVHHQQYLCDPNAVVTFVALNTSRFPPNTNDYGTEVPHRLL